MHLIDHFRLAFWERIIEIIVGFIWLQSEAQICDISPEAKEEISKFRFRRNATNTALICE